MTSLVQFSPQGTIPKSKKRGDVGLELHALDSSEVSSPSSGEVDDLFFVEAKFDITPEVGGNPW